MRRTVLMSLLVVILFIMPGISLRSSSESPSLSGYTICVDAGHGGGDPGAIGYIVEKNVNLAIALKLAELLVADGAGVVMTRSGDYFVSLSERVQIANQAGCDIFVSIHANAAQQESARGVEVYHYPGSSKGASLASKVYYNILSEASLPGRGVKQARYYVLAHTTMPAILVETGFVTNYQDSQYLQDEQGQWSIALGILYGIQEYFGVEKHNPLHPTVTNVRTGDHGSYKRFVVDLTKDTQYITYYWANPQHLAIRIYNTTLDLSPSNGWTQLDSGWYVKATGIPEIPWVYATQYGSDVLIVITTNTTYPYTTFTLQQPDRIVIDIYT